MFRRAQDLPAALEACEGWGCWQQAFVLSAELCQSEEERMALARRMADKMKQKQQHRDAARVLSQYASDPEEAIVVLLEGGAWGDALCMVSSVGIILMFSSCYYVCMALHSCRSQCSVKPYMLCHDNVYCCYNIILQNCSSIIFWQIAAQKHFDRIILVHWLHFA